MACILISYISMIHVGVRLCQFNLIKSGVIYVVFSGTI